MIISDWEPFDTITPAKWYRFFGRRLGTTTIGLAAAFAPTAWYFGVEFITGGSRGMAVCFGPLWVGACVLKPRSPPPIQSVDQNQGEG